MADPEVVKSALQMLAESEGREFKPAPEPEKPQTPQLQPLDQYSAQFGQAAEVAPSTMSYPEQMRNVWETVKPTTQGAQDAAAIAASGIYGTPMDIVGLLGGAREVLKGRIPTHEEMSLPGGSAYLEQKAKEKGTLSQDPSLGATSAGILGSIFADPMAAAGKFGTLAMATMPAKAAGAAEKATPVVEKALAYSRELTPLGLYSHAADTAAAMPQTMPAQQALNWLKGKSGIRNEELMAAGITDIMGDATPEFLEKGKLTGPQFAKMINEGNFPQVTETVLGGDPIGFVISSRTGANDKQEVARFNTQEEAYRFMDEYNRGKPPNQWAQYMDPIYAEGRQKPYYGPDTYPEASTAGGTNYREILLRIPNDPAKYEKGHHPEFPNTVVHTRMQDFTEPGSNGKILRVEEVQSDWSQDARKHGWRMTPEQLQEAEIQQELAAQNFDRASAELDRVYNRVGTSDHPEYQAAYERYANAEDKLYAIRSDIKKAQSESAVPSARYVEETKDWTNLAVRRILREAISNPEYNKLQVSAGDLQAQRWAGAENVQGVAKYYDTTLKSALEREVKKLDPEAKVTKRPYQRETDFDPELDDVADRIRDAEREMEDLMETRGYYQEGSPEYTEVETAISQLEENISRLTNQYEEMTKPYHFYEVEITPKMAEAIAKGLPRFKRGGKVNPHSESIVNKALVLSSKLG